MYWCQSEVIIQPGFVFHMKFLVLNTWTLYLFKCRRPGVYDVHVGQTIKISRLSHFISGQFSALGVLCWQHSWWGQDGLWSRDTIEWFWQSGGSGRDGTRQFVQEAVEGISMLDFVVKIINDRDSLSDATVLLFPWMSESYKQLKRRQILCLYISIFIIFHVFITLKRFIVQVTQMLKTPCFIHVFEWQKPEVKNFTLTGGK